MLAKPETTFLEPFALRTLMTPSSSLRRSSAVGCLATPPMSSTGFSGAGAAPSAFGALAGLLSAAGAVFAGFSAEAAAFGAFSFLGADFYSAMTGVV